MRKTSLIPVLNSISNAEITALTNGEKLLKFTNIFDDETLRLFHQARYILEPSIVPGQEPVSYTHLTLPTTPYV